MCTVNRFFKKGPATTSGRRLVVALAVGALSLSCVQAQTAPAKGNAQAPSDFSIEAEMLTYRALESNSEAIACDTAAYINGGNANFTNPPAGSVCDVKAGTKKAIVVLLPFDSSEFADFQIWRADMATMARLQSKAEELGCSLESKKGATKGGTSAATSPAGTLLSMSPAGPPLALAQSALALMASEESTSSVAGTIHDQAFMDGIGRELQELNVSVLMPTAYTPYSLALLDRSDSPFLASLDRLLAARGCLQALAAKDETKASTVQRAVSDIDVFLSTLYGGAVSVPKSSQAPAAKSGGTMSAPKSLQAPVAGPGGGILPEQNSDGSQTVVTTAAPFSSNLAAVLMADGLAVKFGVDPDTGTLSPENEALLHFLLVKALESGGSVTRRSNILGTKISYSGGSVGTYALFSIDGNLECSGNVYEYGGSLKGKDFQRELGMYHPDPAKQMVFLRHSCRPEPQTQ